MPRQLKAKHSTRKVEPTRSSCNWCIDGKPCTICDNCVAMFRRILQSTSWNVTLRHNHLAEQPMCVSCKEKGWYTAASDVDHILPWRTHPHLFWIPSNHQSLCHQCHSRKTASERTDKNRLFRKTGVDKRP